jgi:H/ACA ribonucleoprotein complex subunit 2
MASEKVEKKEKKKDKKEKKEKKSKHLEDGVTKSKSDKKEKKKSKEKSDSIVQQLQDVATSLVPAIANGDDQDDIDEEAMDLDLITKDVPFDALVPFANPLADEKQTKKLLKSVKKGKSFSLHSSYIAHFVKANMTM